MPSSPTERVTVHSSWRGLAAALASPLLLLAFGAMVIATGGVGPVAIVVIALGLVLGGVSLLDYPRRAEFTPAGIDRVCFLRRQHLPWSEVVALERTRPGVRSLVGSGRPGLDRPVGDDRPGPRDRRVTGGLVARGFGSRRYLLTDQVEGQLEFDAIAALVRRLDLATNLRAGRPSLDTPPSDLYRRKRPDERQVRP